MSLTQNELRVLRALATPGSPSRGGAWQIYALRRQHPGLLPGQAQGNVITAHSLLRKGLLRRVHRAVPGLSGGRVCWLVTDAGKAVTDEEGS